MLEQYGHAVRGAGCPPFSPSRFSETGLGDEVGLSGILSNCPTGFSLSPSPNLCFLSGRPIFHRPANSAVSSPLQNGEGCGTLRLDGEWKTKNRPRCVFPPLLPACVGEGERGVEGAMIRLTQLSGFEPEWRGAGGEVSLVGLRRTFATLVLCSAA